MFRTPALSAALICSLVVPGSARDAGADVTTLQRTLELVRQASRAETTDAVTLRQELAAQGDAAIPMLFAVADTGIVPSGVVEPEIYVVPPPVLATIWATFAELRPSAIRDHVEGFARADVPARTRMTALRLVGGTGATGDLVLMAGLAAPERTDPSPDMVAAFQRALATLVDREPSALRWIQELFEEAHPALWKPTLQVISRSQEPDRLMALASLLGAVPKADAFVIGEIGGLARRGLGTLDEYVRGSVRGYLDSKDENLLRAATRTSGELCDEAAVADLIHILGREDEETAKIAHAALRCITSCDLGSQASRWEAWHREEQRFWREESHIWIASLRSSEPADVARSLNKLSTWRLYRHELASAIVPVLDRSEPSLRRMACAALAALGSPAVREEIEPLLHDRDPSVAEAAREALSRLSYRVLIGD